MSTHATVAIIEDEPDIRQVLRDILKDEGYPVVEAGTGRAGLALLRAAPDGMVVLLDEYLPDVRGTAILRTVLAEPALQRHQFIICTASPKVNPERLALRTQLGAPLLGKPFDLDAVVRLVAEAAHHLPWLP